VLNTPWRDSFQRVVDVYNVHNTALQKYGVSRKDSKLGISRMTFVGETEADVRKQLPMIRFNQDMLLHLHNGTARVKDGSVLHEIAVDAQTGERRVESDRFGWGGATGAFSDDQLYDNLLLGTPDQVRAKIQQYADLGVDHLILYMPFGAPQEDVLRSLRLFGTEVLPHFKKQPVGSGARA
jgi:alkanesulfonate monooxygenase SsuD/methylene tetrahydromethanopterin reductase-like flavin-dependent oxidoreductase (luciferase family)